MLANSNLISCNFSSPLLSPIKNPTKPFTPTSLQIIQHPRNLKKFLPLVRLPNIPLTHISNFLKLHYPNPKSSFLTHQRKEGSLQVCYSLLKDSNKEETGLESEGNGKQEGRNWTTSVLLLVFYGVLLYYVFNLAPNQTPTSDVYFLQRLLYLKGDDGFRMNEVLVALWYIMGLWPVVYSMLLLPTARSSKSKVPVWPFCIASFFGGIYVLLPYFVLWRPPPPPVEESELGKWPLNFLESKLTAGISLAAGLGLIVYAGLAGGDVWMEFYQYFRQSKLIHVTSLDFTLLSAFAPFWVYNDMTARNWYDKGSWLLPLSLVPLVGPALYLILRPRLSELPVSVSSTSSKENED